MKKLIIILLCISFIISCGLIFDRPTLEYGTLEDVIWKDYQTAYIVMTMNKGYNEWYILARLDWANKTYNEYNEIRLFNDAYCENDSIILFMYDGKIEIYNTQTNQAENCYIDYKYASFFNNEEIVGLKDSILYKYNFITDSQSVLFDGVTNRSVDALLYSKKINTVISTSTDSKIEIIDLNAKKSYIFSDENIVEDPFSIIYIGEIKEDLAGDYDFKLRIGTSNNYNFLYVRIENDSICYKLSDDADDWFKNDSGYYIKQGSSAGKIQYYSAANKLISEIILPPLD